MSNSYHEEVIRMAAIFATFLVLFSSIIPLIGENESDAAAGDYYSYTISPDGHVVGNYTPVGVQSSIGTTWNSSDGSNVGSWGFDSEGYGPFNSFYAAFDPDQNNKMICHLNPYNLRQSIDGQNIHGNNYNVMWCLPTVYWYSDSNGNLTLTNNPNSGGVAYAHTIDGKVYEYIGIAVYEAALITLDDGTETFGSCASKSTPWDEYGDAPNYSKSEYREYVERQSVATTGESVNGHAMLWNYYMWQLYKFCGIVVMDDFDSQAAVGNGKSYMGSYDRDYGYITGSLDDDGPYAGTIGDPALNGTYHKNPVKLFIENAWGTNEDFVDGVVLHDRRFYVDQSSSPTDTTSGEYVTQLDLLLPNTRDFFYVKTVSTDPTTWGIGATSTSYRNALFDDKNGTNEDDGIYIVVAGGLPSPDVTLSDEVGIMAYLLCDVDAKGNHLGGRIAFVFDDDPGVSSTVTFVSNGTTYQTQTVNSGQYAVAPTDPTLYGYVFKGWFTDDGTFQNEFNFATPITSNITLYAKWEGDLQFTTDPTAQGTVTPIEGMAGAIALSATPSSDYTSVLWDFGDGTTSTNTYATHYYGQPGTYVVKLTVFNNHGSDVTTYMIEVPSADSGDDGTEWALVAAVVLIAFVSGALIARRLL